MATANENYMKHKVEDKDGFLDYNIGVKEVPKTTQPVGHRCHTAGPGQKSASPLDITC